MLGSIADNKGLNPTEPCIVTVLFPKALLLSASLTWRQPLPTVSLDLGHFHCKPAVLEQGLPTHVNTSCSSAMKHGWRSLFQALLLSFLIGSETSAVFADVNGDLKIYRSLSLMYSGRVPGAAMSLLVNGSQRGCENTETTDRRSPHDGGRRAKNYGGTKQGMDMESYWWLTWATTEASPRTSDFFLSIPQTQPHRLFPNFGF